MIQFTCPCGKTLDASDEQVGQTTRCPECGRELAVPGGAAMQTADAPRASAVPRDEGVRTGPTLAGAGRQDQPPAPTTSGMAVGSLVLGVLSLFCSLWTAVPAVVVGAIALWDISRSQGRKKGKGLAITGIVLGVVLPVAAFLIVLRVRETANKLRTVSNLMNIFLAMDNYNTIIGTYPPAAICDRNGKPLLSWRVAILPYIEQENLYMQFKLDEPWDGPNNSRLLSQMPKDYAPSGDPAAPPGYTYYRVFVGHGAAFDPPHPVTQADWVPMLRPGLRIISGGAHGTDFTDGAAHTIFVVEAAQAVPWTKPEELDYDPNGPLPPLGGHFSGGFHVLLGDMKVKFVTPDVSPATLRAAITRSGGETLPPDW